MVGLYFGGFVFAVLVAAVFAGCYREWERMVTLKPLTPVGGGWWSTSRAIGSGAHEMNVRVNGGAWEPPPGLVAIRDEFGGTTGLLVIP